MAARRTAEAIITTALRLVNDVEENRVEFDSHDVHYSYMRKHLRIGRHEALTNPGIRWRLPHSFEALYQLSEMPYDVFDEVIQKITKTTELETVKALIHEAKGRKPKERPAVPELRLYCAPIGEYFMREWLKTVYHPRPQRHIQYSDGRRRTSIESGMDGFLGIGMSVFYLVRKAKDGTPILYDLRESQIKTIIDMLREKNEPIVFNYLATSVTAPPEKPRPTPTRPKTYEEHLASVCEPPDLWDNLNEHLDRAEGIPTPPRPDTIPIPITDGQVWQKINRTEYSIFGDSLGYRNAVFDRKFFDVTGRPLPEKIVRYVEWRRYIPKPA